MEPLINDFQAFHNYRRLADEGLVDPITCSQDEYELVTQRGAFGELVLRCYGCGRVIVPGQGLIDRVKAEVRQHVQ